MIVSPAQDAVFAPRFRYPPQSSRRPDAGSRGGRDRRWRRNVWTELKNVKSACLSDMRSARQMSDGSTWLQLIIIIIIIITSKDTAAAECVYGFWTAWRYRLHSRLQHIPAWFLSDPLRTQTTRVYSESLTGSRSSAALQHTLWPSDRYRIHRLLAL